jgi:hypothetical protein
MGSFMISNTNSRWNYFSPSIWLCPSLSSHRVPVLCIVPVLSPILFTLAFALCIHNPLPLWRQTMCYSSFSSRGA